MVEVITTCHNINTTVFKTQCLFAVGRCYSPVYSLAPAVELLGSLFAGTRSAGSGRWPVGPLVRLATTRRVYFRRSPATQFAGRRSPFAVRGGTVPVAAGRRSLVVWHLLSLVAGGRRSLVANLSRRVCYRLSLVAGRRGFVRRSPFAAVHRRRSGRCGSPVTIYSVVSRWIGRLRF